MAVVFIGERRLLVILLQSVAHNRVFAKRKITENILSRVMCEYKEDLNTGVRLNENGFV